MSCARHLRHPGIAIVIAFFAVSIVGPWVSPFDPTAIDLAHQYETPSATHWLGTADNGVDVLSVLLSGARLAATVGLWVVLLSALVGGLLGAWAGYRGGKIDQVVTAVADLFQAFPAIILNISILAVVSRPGISHLVFALSFTGWVLYARLTRSLVLTLREREFVTAAVALGASETRVVVRHLAPNVAGPLLVQATSGFGAAVLAESALSFLGVGPGTGTSWGALLDQGSNVLLRFPHVALFSGAAIATTVLGFNLAGDRLRDLLDPRS